MQIAGLGCQLHKGPFGDICVVTNGQMKPAYPLVLMRGFEAMQMKAVRAEQDITVSEQLFAPHLQGGFTVQEIKK